MTQQQGLLQPQRTAEDLALRNQQLSRGRIGMGISSEAAGAGVGGYVNQEQFQRDRARAQADAQIAANATQAGQTQQANQLQYTQGLFNAGNAPEQYGMGQLTLADLVVQSIHPHIHQVITYSSTSISRAGNKWVWCVHS